MSNLKPPEQSKSLPECYREGVNELVFGYEPCQGPNEVVWCTCTQVWNTLLQGKFGDPIGLSYQSRFQLIDSWYRTKVGTGLRIICGTMHTFFS